MESTAATKSTITLSDRANSQLQNCFSTVTTVSYATQLSCRGACKSPLFVPYVQWAPGASVSWADREQCCKASPRVTPGTHSHESSPCAGAACAHPGGQSSDRGQVEGITGWQSPAQLPAGCRGALSALPLPGGYKWVGAEQSWFLFLLASIRMGAG